MTSVWVNEPSSYSITYHCSELNNYLFIQPRHSELKPKKYTYEQRNLLWAPIELMSFHLWEQWFPSLQWCFWADAHFLNILWVHNSKINLKILWLLQNFCGVFNLLDNAQGFQKIVSPCLKLYIIWLHGLVCRAGILNCYSFKNAVSFFPDLMESADMWYYAEMLYHTNLSQRMSKWIYRILSTCFLIFILKLGQAHLKSKITVEVMTFSGYKY